MPYRRSAGIVVINGDGLVWVGHRVTTAESTDQILQWQMPQGGIDDGEEPRAAALRELFEETGIRSLEFLGEAPQWINYDLPDQLIGFALKGKFRGQTQKWFAYRFVGSEDEIAINPPPDGHKAEFDAWKWVDINELPDLIVPFKRPVYRELVRIFQHLTL